MRHNTRMGSHNLNIATGFHSPGMEFEPHRHPLSEEQRGELDGSDF